jgi:hypothetical protein
LASTNLGATQAANYIPELWALGATDAVQFKQVIAKRVNREFEGEIKDMGDTVNIPSMSNFTAVDKTTNTDLDAEAFTHPVQQLVINKHKAVAVKIERFAERQAMPGYREKITRRLGYPIARVMETDLSALFDGFSTNGTVGTAGQELGISNYRTAWTNLVTAGAIEEAMTDEDTSIFLSPGEYAAALSQEVLISKDYGDNGDAISKAALGAIFGSRVFLSNLLESDGAGQHDNAWINKNVLTLAVQQAVRVETDYRPMAIATEIVADAIYGVKELTRPGESNANVTLTDNFGQYLAGT